MNEHTSRYKSHALENSSALKYRLGRIVEITFNKDGIMHTIKSGCEWFSKKLFFIFCLPNIYVTESKSL